MIADAQAVFDRWQIDIDPRRVMQTLSVAQMQMVEIAKAISYGARLIIMDEPTSAITEREVEHLHRMIRALRESGVAIIYITHKMDEVFEIADDVTVFRDGKHVGHLPAAELDRQKLISLMVGRELTHLFPKEDGGDRRGGDVRPRPDPARRDRRHQLRSAPRRDPRHRRPDGRRPHRARSRRSSASTKATPARSRSTAARAIKSPADAIEAGMGLLTEDRKLTGIMGCLSVRDNMTIANLNRFSPGGILRKRAIEAALRAPSAMRSRSRRPSLAQLIKNLSGGNQQKVADLALAADDARRADPRRADARHRRRRQVRDLPAHVAGLPRQGKAILMVSSELPEILGMSDRILVMAGAGSPRSSAAPKSRRRRSSKRRRSSRRQPEAGENDDCSSPAGVRRRQPRRADGLRSEVPDRLHLPGDVVLLAIFSPNNSFVQPQNLINVVRQISVIGLLALGVSVCIIAMGIDLSLGSVLGLSAVVTASLVQQIGWKEALYDGFTAPWFVAVLAGLSSASSRVASTGA